MAKVGREGYAVAYIDVAQLKLGIGIKFSFLELCLKELLKKIFSHYVSV